MIIRAQTQWKFIYDSPCESGCNYHHINDTEIHINIYSLKSISIQQLHKQRKKPVHTDNQIYRIKANKT